MEVPGLNSGNVKTSKNFRIFRGHSTCETVFSRKLIGEERRPTSRAVTGMMENETTGPASNGVSRHCECSQRIERGTNTLSDREDYSEKGEKQMLMT